MLSTRLADKSENSWLWVAHKHLTFNNVEGCFAIIQNQAMYIFGPSLGRHFYLDHEFAMEVDPAVTLGVAPADELGRYPCRLRY